MPRPRKSSLRGLIFGRYISPKRVSKSNFTVASAVINWQNHESDPLPLSINTLA